MVVSPETEQRIQSALRSPNTSKSSLAAPLRLETGSLVTLKMRGHTHSPGGLEYYTPAVVLAQYADQFGSIDALVWDSTSGTHLASGYHVRELGAEGDGGERVMVETQSNIGRVLFSPDQFSEALQMIEIMGNEIDKIQRRLGAIERETGAVPVTGAAPPLSPSKPK